jgi:hypothetical protein
VSWIVKSFGKTVPPTAFEVRSAEAAVDAAHTALRQAAVEEVQVGHADYGDLLVVLTKSTRLNRERAVRCLHLAMARRGRA